MKAASLDRSIPFPRVGPAESGLKSPARRTAVYVGLLFLVQMLTAMVGISMIDTFVAGGAGAASARVGALLMTASGIAVTGIGFLMYPILKMVNAKLAAWYPALRVVELSVSAAGAVYLITRLSEVPNHMLWIYLPTGAGGLVLNYLLYVGKLVPRPIAVLGFAGYALLLSGAVADLLGVVDMNNGPGMVLLVPGGLFEFVVLPIWLFAKGFRLPAAHS
jgi:hypothetical protein